MRLKGNTILITGGGSGIGRGLAEAFHRLGNQVIITGRRQAALDRVVAEHPGMRALTFDITDSGRIGEFSNAIAAEFPELNVLINNAGIQSPERLRGGRQDLSKMEDMVTTNLLGPIHLTTALLPLLERQPQATIMNVTSGLAFLPLAGVPTYCATKAAMHSYTQTLRYQLRTTNVEVSELIPPYVQTDLGPHHGTDARAMPLAEFINEVITILENTPSTQEIVVERCRPLRYATESGSFDQTFRALNEAME